MPTTRDALLAAIRVNLDDDLPRLVFADWLDEHGDAARAAFIRRQCTLARTPNTEAVFFDLRHELTLHPADPAWRAELPPVLRTAEPVYARGFVDAVSLTAKKLLAGGDDVFAGTAVRAVALTSVKGLVPAVRDCPALADVQALDLTGNKIGADGVAALLGSRPRPGLQTLLLGSMGATAGLGRALAETPALPNVRRLGLGGCNLRDAGLDRIAAAPHFAGLTALGVGGCGAGPRGLKAVADRLPRLRALNFAGNTTDEDAAAVLLDPHAFPELVELNVYSHPNYGGIAPFLAWGDLVRTPLFRRLKLLSLYADAVPAAVWRTGPADVGPPGLALDFTSPRPQTVLGLAASPLLGRCSWLTLGLPGRTGPAALRAVAENPAAAHLRGLTIVGYPDGPAPDLGRTSAAVAASPHLAGLLDFDYEEPITDKDLANLAAAPFAKHLRRLAITDERLTAKGLKRLARPDTFPSLRFLSMDLASMGVYRPASAHALRERFGPAVG